MITNETSNNTTLIIDGNWLLMSRASIMLKSFSKSLSPDELSTSRDELADLLARSVHRIISLFSLFSVNLIDNVILVQDGGSWRKYIPKPTSYQDDLYKGKRSFDDDVNWEYIWGAHDIFFQKCEENHMSTFKAAGVEGDDWIWYWTNKLGGMGVNSIIWSTDADLKQLIKFHESGAWTCEFNDKNGLFFPIYPPANASELDLFMLDINNQTIMLENILSYMMTLGYKTTPVNNEDIVMIKTICGDDSDNIKSVIQYKQPKRTLRTSEKEWLSIKDNLNIRTLKEFFASRDNIIKALKNLKRFIKNTDTVEILIENFEYNKKLVFLDESSYPLDILESIRNQNEYMQFNLDEFKNNYNILSPIKPVDEISLFDGFEF